MLHAVAYNPASCFRKFLAIGMCLSLASCNYLGQNNVPQKLPRQRFIPVPREGAPAATPWSGAFALDTKKGTTLLDLQRHGK
jgi:hypothetical protein